MYEQDYYMRLIHEMIRMTFKLICNIDIDKKDEFADWSADDIIEFDHIKQLADQGNIDEAENKLWEDLDGKDQRKLELALRFYEYLNKKDNDYLESHDFTKEEIKDGVYRAVDLYGYSSIFMYFESF